MPTPMHQFAAVASKYGIDPRDDEAVDEFFVTKFPTLPAEEQELVLQGLLEKETLSSTSGDAVPSAFLQVPSPPLHQRETPPVPIIRYDTTKAVYANHVLVSAGTDEVYLDFTSGIVADRSGTSILPIHTRIAITPSTAIRLSKLVAQVIANFQVVQVQPPAEFAENALLKPATLNANRSPER